MADPIIETVQPLVTLDVLKANLGIALEETARDAVLQAMIEFASGQIAAHCRRSFIPEVVTGELHDGDGTNLLIPRHTPIVSVQAMSIDGASIDSAELRVYFEFIKFEDSDYNPRLRTGSRLFPVGTQNVALDYTHGYAKVPYEISRACIAQVIYLRNTLNKLGITSETDAGAQATSAFSQAELAPPVKAVCAHFRPQRMAAV